MVKTQPRGIAVVDVGYTNTKVLLFDCSLNLLSERKLSSPHHDGAYYREIDVEPMLAFFVDALPELDAIVPVDTIVTSAHGACIVAARPDGKPAVPIMDYMSEPPPAIVAAYSELSPSYAETFSPQLPVALLHAMQLFWQQRIMPEALAQAVHILPFMQYIGWRLGGQPVTEISSMGCQSHLLNLSTLGPSTLALSQGWAAKFAPRVNAWDVIGKLDHKYRGQNFRGKGNVLAGVHDSNANYLRYLSGGIGDFTLLSTGTWIIGFDTKADIRELDPIRDIVANVDCLGRVVACCRFFGGKEFELVASGAEGAKASLSSVHRLIAQDVMALPNFTDSGGPLPGFKGKVIGTVSSEEDRASLASLYCALMVSESLDAIKSSATIIVDGPFSQNNVFLAALANLRPHQKLMASNLKEGTAAGAACLALMPDGLLPHIDIGLSYFAPPDITGLSSYQTRWRQRTKESAP